VEENVQNLTFPPKTQH